MFGINIWKLLIVLLIVVLIFGTKRLKSIAADLGGAAKNLRDSVGHSGEAAPTRTTRDPEPDAEFSEQKDHSGRS